MARLRQLAAVGLDDERQVQVAWPLEFERLLKRELPARTRQQVGSAHDIGDALIGIVNHASELIAVQPIATSDYDVALNLRLESQLAETTIGDRAGRKYGEIGSQRRTLRVAVTTSAVAHATRVVLAEQVATRAITKKERHSFAERGQCLGIPRRTIALARRR